MKTFICTIDTPLGKMVASSRQDKISGLWFVEQRHFPDTSEWIEKETYLFDDLKAWLESYFKGAINNCSLPLLLDGTPFQLRVWGILCQIPYGGTTTYGSIAAQLSSTSARMVGAAVGRNNISIIIPCHRVLGHDGSLVGYAGGLYKKRFLLELENSGFK